MRYRFLTTDVFTDRIFGGNPLAVLPDARGLDTSQMQALAREFNLSETVFVLPPDDPAHSRKLRIFTPARRGAVCRPPDGRHSSASWPRSVRSSWKPRSPRSCSRRVPGRCRSRSGRQAAGPAFAELTAPEPPEVRPAPDPVELAAMLALAPSDLRTEAGLPEMASCGLPFLIVELRDAAALGRVRLDRAVWQRLLADAWAREVYLVTRDVAGEDADFRVRMFAPAAGIGEDPATGAAAAAFGGWLGLRDGDRRRDAALRHRPGRRDGSAEPARGGGREARRRGRRGPGRRQCRPGQRRHDRGTGGRLNRRLRNQALSLGRTTATSSRRPARRRGRHGKWSSRRSAGRSA